PIIDTTKGAVKSYRLPPKTIALTFDDGPDPTWTPKIMDVLRKYHVVGTYFVVGSQVARYPAIVRNLAEGGDEIAIHTLTHPNMAELPQWRQQLEYSQTQLAIIGATGRKAALLRLPYSSKVDAIDDTTWKLIKQAGQLGYLSVMTETDSQDWSKPGVDKVVDNAVPMGGKSSIVLMHDAGGDRSQTVAALDILIPRMLAKGSQFTTSSEAPAETLAQNANAATVPNLAGNPKAGQDERRRGLALVAAVGISDDLFAIVRWLFMVVGVLMIARTLLLFTLAR